MKVGSGTNSGANPSVRATASEMAGQLSNGFQAHDKKRRQDAIDAFTAVDRRQFASLSDRDARQAATAFVDALWAKDEIEFRHLRDGEIDRDGIRDADYTSVKQKLRKRAWITDVDSRYAELKAEAWREHKADGDYWTPFQRSQVLELRAILQSPDYPHKQRGGQAGPGPEPMRYILAFELHDMKDPDYWTEGERVMIPYFERILLENTDAS